MYESLGVRGAVTVARDRPLSPARAGAGRIGPTILLLGLTSLLTDISSEMVNAVLPLYLMLQLGFTPLHFGVFDGLYQGVTAVVRIAGGLVADRRRRYREVAAAGYGLSAACKLGLWAAAPLWLPTLGLLMLDRVGKGVRTGPRDALISLSSAPARRAEAFGVHRALDTTGALLGPLVAFALLGLVPGGYDVVFVLSFWLGILGLSVLLFFVHNPRGTPDVVRPPTSLRTAIGLLRGRAVRSVVVAAAVLSLATVSDGFVYLTLQRRAALDPQYFPLLSVGTALIYLLLAVPLGRWADRAGRRRIFLAGHLPLAGVYAMLLWRSEPGLVELVGCVGLLGVYYAATDGVLAAIASSHLPSALLTSGLALLTTVTAIGRLAGLERIRGALDVVGLESALGLFLAGLLASTAVAGRVLATGLRPAKP